MKLIPMGEYYVWHCDWCDSTNHTLCRPGADGLTCAACHNHQAEHPAPPHTIRQWAA